MSASAEHEREREKERSEKGCSHPEISGSKSAAETSVRAVERGLWGVGEGDRALVDGGEGEGTRANNLAGQRRVGLRKSVVFPKSRLRSPVVWLLGKGGTVF